MDFIENIRWTDAIKQIMVSLLPQEAFPTNPKHSFQPASRR